MITATTNTTPPAPHLTGEEAASPKSPSALRRLGSGAFGAGTLGVLGLLYGFLVPLATLVIRLLRGPSNPGPGGGIVALFPEAMEMIFGLIVGFAQGAVGLVAGLAIGFIVGAIGQPEARPGRMRIAALALGVVALGFAIHFGLEITKPLSPQP